MLRGPPRGAEKLGTLPCPHRQQRLEQFIELKLGRPSSCCDCFNDIRREQGQPQNATEIGVVDLLGLGQVGCGCVFAVLQHFALAMGAYDGLEQGMIDARRGRPRYRTWGRQDLLAAGTLAKSDGNSDRDGSLILADGDLGRGDRGGHVTSCFPVELVASSVTSVPIPSIRSLTSMPSTATSTRSTRSRTMRACSAGNNSPQSGSNSTNAVRTSASVNSGNVSRGTLNSLDFPPSSCAPYAMPATLSPSATSRHPAPVRPHFHRSGGAQHRVREQERFPEKRVGHPRYRYPAARPA